MVTAVKADSREVGSGELFVALNTGVRYVEEARARRGDARPGRPGGRARHARSARSIEIGRAGRRRRRLRGQDDDEGHPRRALRAACPTIWAERSMNNEIGLPLTVCRLEPDTEVLVTEMGMRGIGQVAVLCVVARPTVVVVPHVGPEHLELLGSVERVAEANAEAIAALPAGGVAVVPAAGPLDPYLVRDDITIRRFEAGDVQHSKRSRASRSGTRPSTSSSRSRNATSSPTRSPHFMPMTRSVCHSTGHPKASPASSSLPGEATRSAPGWRVRRQRRLQRQPRLDAGRARASRGARR